MVKQRKNLSVYGPLKDIVWSWPSWQRRGKRDPSSVAPGGVPGRKRVICMSTKNNNGGLNEFPAYLVIYFVYALFGVSCGGRGEPHYARDVCKSTAVFVLWIAIKAFARLFGLVELGPRHFFIGLMNRRPGAFFSLLFFFSITSDCIRVRCFSRVGFL